MLNKQFYFILNHTALISIGGVLSTIAFLISCRENVLFVSFPLQNFICYAEIDY